VFGPATALAVASLLPAQPAAKPFELKDGDRVVWIGSTLVEREQRYGYWETALYLAFPNANFTIRNLGWSGDTVWGESRGRFDFDKPDVCFKQLVDQTLALKPTVVFVSYGTVESFEGEEGLPKFEKGLGELLDALKPANARDVLLTPAPAEIHPRYPHAKARNAVLDRYAGVIRKVAADRNLFCADLYRAVLSQYERYDGLRQRRAIADEESFTEDGMHLSATGYQITWPAFLGSLGVLSELPPCPVGLKLDVPALLKLPSEAWEPLRQAVIAKNELFFHRWRPQNETYLFGFRKHEQGKNAKEVAEFDPLVAKAEEEIARVRKTLTK
jgi:lysophospholipase L1-like esterase